MNRVAAMLRWLAPRGLIVTLLGLVAAAAMLHVAVAPVLTGSMTPTFRPGAAIITRTVPVDQVRVGQVAVVVPPGHTAAFAHRIVSVSGDPAHPTIRTKGDANSAPDPWSVRLSGSSVPEVAAHLPSLGRVLVLPHQPAGRALLVGLLGMFLTGLAIRLVLSTPGPASGMTATT